MRRLRSPSGAARLRPQVVRTRVLRSKTLLWRDSFPPKDGGSGPPYECGLTIEKFNDIKEGDIVEAFTMEEIPQ